VLRRAFLLLLSCCALSGVSTRAQSSTDIPVCPSTGKLICALPEVYGINGLQEKIGPLQAGSNTNHKGGHFESDFISSLGPLNAAVGSELTLLPLGSPGSGLVYVYDPALKTFTASTEDLGPILTERANTTGKHKFRLGFSYQRFNFGTLDGNSIHNLPASFTHVDDIQPDSTGTANPPFSHSTSNCFIGTQPLQNGPNNTSYCGFVRDRIDTVTDINLTLNQYTASATLGLTSRIDISLAIPIINVGMGLSSTATIHNASFTDDHLFKAAFCSPTTASCRTTTFSSSNSASGIGDLVLRAKGVIWSGERAAFAVGADLRFPTGDEQNFLGSGTYGFTPFAVFSYSARVSPHVNVGFEENGNSALAGDIIGPDTTTTPATPSTIKKGHLPNQFLYSGGVDVVILEKRLAGTFDLIGQRVLNAERATVMDQPFLGDCDTTVSPPSPTNTNYCTSPASNVSLSTLTRTRGSFNITNASLGAKVRVSDKFVFFGNVLIKLDDGGLRAKFVPLVGASFSF
jgi:hypothetical protein